MRAHLAAMTAATAVVMTGGSAQACYAPARLELEDVKYADAVISGRIVNYRIVRDQKARRDRRALLALSPNMAPEMRKELKAQKDFLTDYASFEIVVEQVLKGKTPRKVSVTWDNSTFGEPEMLRGRHLVALRDPRSKAPPLRGPSATFFPNPRRDVLTVPQAPCAPAFVFKEDEQAARQLRRLMGRPAK